PVSCTITSFFPVTVQLLGTMWGFTEQETVTGLFSKDCILPCPFQAGDDEVIYWKKGEKTVHSYYYQRDQLERQDSDYRHRTHLFHQNIPSGNASLKLSNLTLTDEGRYNCYVGTRQTKTEVEKTDTERMLKCYAFLAYPAPRISWVQGNTSIQETYQEETRDGVLYSLRSDQNIINTADPYYCHIHLPHEEWAAEWKMRGRNEWNSLPASLLNVTGGFRAELNTVFLQWVQINQNDFSLMLRDLTANDSGEYLCNISTPHYTKLTVRTLQVGKLLLFPFWRMGTSEGNAGPKELRVQGNSQNHVPNAPLTANMVFKCSREMKRSPKMWYKFACRSNLVDENTQLLFSKP
uniref:Ig-like domain-containing protein n=1 Tax=Accipiter nisus TaxID=211598 RepID=A0A8B9N1B2_9AVES